MPFTISTKQFQPSDNEYLYIERLVKKLLLYTPWNDSDFPLLEIVIRKHRKRSLKNFEKTNISAENAVLKPEYKSIDNPIYYDGSLDFILPKKRILAKMLGKTVREAVKEGFDKLFIELDKYKGFHFANDSEYHNRKTIRRVKEKLQ